MSQTRSARSSLVPLFHTLRAWSTRFLTHFPLYSSNLSSPPLGNDDFLSTRLRFSPNPASNSDRKEQSIVPFSRPSNSTVPGDIGTTVSHDKQSNIHFHYRAGQQTAQTPHANAFTRTKTPHDHARISSAYSACKRARGDTPYMRLQVRYILACVCIYMFASLPIDGSRKFVPLISDVHVHIRSNARCCFRIQEVSVRTRPLNAFA